MNFRKKNNDGQYTLYGNVSKVDLKKRAETLFNYPVDSFEEELDFSVMPDEFLQNINYNKPLPKRKTVFDDRKIQNNQKIQPDKNKPVNYINTKPSNIDKIEVPAKKTLSTKMWDNLKVRIYDKSRNIIKNDYESLGRYGARLLGGYETDENLYMALADHYLDTPYARQHTIYNSYKEVSPFLREHVKNKILKQLGPQYLNIKGIYFDNDSYTSKRIALNTDVKLFVKRNKEYLKNYGFINKDSIQFTDNNFHNAIGKADIIDMYLTGENEIVFYIIDTYDFNKYSSNPFVWAGKENQDNGILIPYFMIYSVKIDRETTERYLR